MNIKESLLRFFQKVCKFNFGEFELEEFKKFLRMGLIFALIIGVYWTLRPLKDSIFMQLVDKLQLPFAKTISVISLLPIVIAYTKLIEKTSKEKMLIYLPLFYGISILCFSFLIYTIQYQWVKKDFSSFYFLVFIKAVGYVWYLYVESFGSLVVALFWAFSADTTRPEQAKRGFPLVVALGQIGGIIFPYCIGGLPHRLNLSTDFLSMILISFLIFLIVPCTRSFMKKTPNELLQSYEGGNQTRMKKEAGFFEGLKLLIKNRYLLFIFAATFIYEVIVTIFDFNFKVAAGELYSGVALSNYLSIYGSSVNIVSLSCLLLGISNVTRFLGIKIALVLMPIIVGFALLGFLSLNSLSFLFILMVGSKAINYALNGPALKQLYIPTQPDVKFKAQAWIETFGSRTSKQAGSIFNMSLKTLQGSFGQLAGKSYYIFLSGVICFPLLLIWVFVALFLGKTYKKAIDERITIC